VGVSILKLHASSELLSISQARKAVCRAPIELRAEFTRGSAFINSSRDGIRIFGIKSIHDIIKHVMVSIQRNQSATVIITEKRRFC